MNAREAVLWLESMPSLMEIYVKTSVTALEKVKSVRYDKQMGCIEFLTKIEDKK